jgi:hypothetical protein
MFRFAAARDSLIKSMKFDINGVSKIGLKFSAFLIDYYDTERHTRDESIRFMKRLEAKLTNRNSEIAEERLNEIFAILMVLGNLNPHARKILAEQMPQYFQNT